MKNQIEKRKAKIIYGELNNKKNPYFVDFNGWHEWEGYPCESMKEVVMRIKDLVKQLNHKYKIRIFEEKLIEKNWRKLNEI